jgi:hypothetical protein
MFLLGASASKDVQDPLHDRLWWPGLSWPLWAVVSLVVLLMTGGGIALAGARTASQSAAAAATADVRQLAPGMVRIEGTKWTRLSRGGPQQLLVSYRTRRSGTSAVMLLARSRAERRWVPVYSGARLTSDVLVPSGSALEGNVALSLIGTIDRLSHKAYDIAATSANVALLEVWMAHEGGLWADNPLNTSLDASAYRHQFTTSGQDTGIPIYPDLSVGVTDTALTLLGNPAYQGILKVLAGGSGSCMAFGAAVVESPWASSHYGHDAGSFCPSGPALDLAVHSPVAPRGLHRSGGYRVHRQPPRPHGTGRFGSVPTRRGATGTAVSGQPALRGAVDDARGAVGSWSGAAALIRRASGG